MDTLAAPPEKITSLTGVKALFATVVLTFAGFSLLMPISPTWVITQGASETAAGGVTAVLMLFTIATQLAVKKLLRSAGWVATLVAGLAFLAIPAALQALTPNLLVAFATNAARGVGFGILTVCCANALALLVPAQQRGQAVGAYGLAVSIPQLIFSSSAPLLATRFGMPIVIAAGIVPLVALSWIGTLGRRLDILSGSTALSEMHSVSRSKTGLFSILWPTLAVLFVVTNTGGALLTFANQIAPSSSLATLCLLGLTGFAVPARWVAGTLADRIQTRSMVPALMACSVLATSLICASQLLRADVVSSAFFLLSGSALLGIAYGGVQSATLFRAFSDGGPARSTDVSVYWNITFDLGTGVGSLIAGAIAQSVDFTNAFAFLGVTGAIAAVTYRLHGR